MVTSAVILCISVGSSALAGQPADGAPASDRAPATDSAPASASPPKALRPADVEVLLTRALDDLHAGRLREARDETGRILELDPSGRARYYHGVACARLEDWNRAAEMLEPINRGLHRSWFPQLPLELGVVYLHLGRLAEARTLLEEAATLPGMGSEATGYLEQLKQTADSGTGTAPHRSWHIFAALGAGWDSNATGMAGAGWSDCPPSYQGNLTISTSCGALVSERVGGWVRPGLAGQPLQLQYQFQHRWYPDANLEPFRLQDHRFGLEARLPAKLQAGYRLEALSLNGRYRPLYALRQEAELRFRGLARGSWSLEPSYRFAWDRYGDLEEIWNLESDAEALCAAAASTDLNEPRLYCSSGRSGFRHQGQLEVRWRQSRWQGGGTVGLELSRTRSPLYTGFEVWGQAWWELELTRRLRLGASVSASRQVYALWSIDQVQPGLGMRATIREGLELRARYGLNRLRAFNPDPDFTDNDYRRQLAMLELSYVY